MGLFERLRQDWSVIVQAWPSLSLTALALIATTWLVVGWLYRHQLATLKERIALKDDRIKEYERKLDGATPEEAKDRVDALEKLVQHLKPRELTAEQHITLLTHLQRNAGAVRVEFTLGDKSSQDYADTLAGIFREAGWDVQRMQVMTSWGTPNPGLRVLMPLDLPPTPLQQAVVAALAAAGIAFDQGDTMLPEGLDIRVLTGPRLV